MTRCLLAITLTLTPAPLTAPKETPTWPTSPVHAMTAVIEPTISYSASTTMHDLMLDPGSFVEIVSPAPIEPTPPDPVPLTDTTPRSLSDAQLYRLRMCESTDNYGAHLVWGTQWESRATGAYQFEQPTWNGVAARHMPWLVGVRPHHAWPAEQDAMTRWLWSERGRYPWPTCGLRVGAA